MNILFLNASPNHDGNTAALAKALLADQDYEQLDLLDYKIAPYGREFSNDQYQEVLAKVKSADVLVVGSPVYWHNLSGGLRDFLDRCYGPVQSGGLADKREFFLFQGEAPEKWMLEAGEYTMKAFAGLYGMTYEGMATTTCEAKELAGRL